ncbi:MFS transporter [Massilia sp. W12]|uniref:MFS transporter n=1 Tax=Massilia sp. W12 TaxID=3126507 RepID=UPI0030D5E709
MRQPGFLRYWAALSISSFGEQISILALPLCAALMLKASPSQMGMLVALEMLPFVLLSLPAGVWLDRHIKKPTLIFFEISNGLALASIPLAWSCGWLSMPWLYVAAFVVGCGNVVGGSCVQILSMQIVGREHLIDAQSKFALTDSLARLLGPGLAGLLVHALNPPLALLFNGCAFLCTVKLFHSIRIKEEIQPPNGQSVWNDILEGLRFVWRHPTLRALAWTTAGWQILFNGFVALQVLYATREFNMSAGTLGLVQMAGGLGVLLSSTAVKPLVARFGSGNVILCGMSGTVFCWLLLALLPVQLFGSNLLSLGAYGLVFFLFDCTVMLYFMPYLALRVRVTPDAYLGRVVSTMRFLTVAGVPLGAWCAGKLGEWLGLREALGCVAAGGLILALLAWLITPLRGCRD